MPGKLITMPCREWVEGACTLTSAHQWEHQRGGAPIVCTRCGADYAEFQHRAGLKIEAHLATWADMEPERDPEYTPGAGPTDRDTDYQ